MDGRRYFVGLVAGLMAASTLVLAGPAGAASSCDESMNPAASGNASGLIVACTFSSAGVSTGLTIQDYADAEWHWGAARSANVTVARTTVGGVPSTAGKLTIKSRPLNNTAAASCANSPAGQTAIPAGNLAISALDINHSIEFVSSNTTLTGKFINPGSFIKAVAAPTGTGCAQTTVVTLSKATLAGGPLCPASPGPATGNCANSVGAQVLISNDSGRAAMDGVTTAGSNAVTSASAHFCTPTFFAGASTDVAANTINKAGHVLANGDKVRLAGLTTTTGVTNGTTYFVVNAVAGTSFKLALTAGGVARDLTGSNQSGTVSVGPATPECGSAATQQTDVGKRLSGGDLPDGATIATVNSVRNVTLTCTGCGGGFALVSSASNQVLSLSPGRPPTSSRYVTDGTASGTRVLSSATAKFAASDVGLPIVFVPPIATLAGARVGTITSGGGKKFVIGQATKTAPATGDAIGSLSILLVVSPTVSPTSPPCAANKVSGFQIPLLWRNPQGTVALATNTGTGGYNTFTGGTHLSGVSPAATSIAQFDFRTASTSFSGYLRQNYTVTGTAQGASTYAVQYTFLPVSVGLCAGTGDAATWQFNGLSKKIVENPSFTGGGGGGVRGIVAEPQNTSQVYSGQPLSATSGAYVTSVSPPATEQPSNTNACTISSPSLIQIGC